MNLVRKRGCILPPSQSQPKLTPPHIFLCCSFHIATVSGIVKVNDHDAVIDKKCLIFFRLWTVLLGANNWQPVFLMLY